MAFFTSFSHQNVMLFLATVIIVIHEFFTDSELFEWKPNNTHPAGNAHQPTQKKRKTPLPCGYSPPAIAAGELSSY